MYGNVKLNLGLYFVEYSKRCFSKRKCILLNQQAKNINNLLGLLLMQGKLWQLILNKNSQLLCIENIRENLHFKQQKLSPSKENSNHKQRYILSCFEACSVQRFHSQEVDVWEQFCSYLAKNDKIYILRMHWFNYIRIFQNGTYI